MPKGDLTATHNQNMSEDRELHFLSAEGRYRSYKITVHCMYCNIIQSSKAKVNKVERRQRGRSMALTQQGGDPPVSASSNLFRCNIFSLPMPKVIF